MSLTFVENPRHTVGVEVEMQLVHPETYQLAPAIEELTRRASGILGQNVKPELMQSYVEINTDVCEDMAGVRQDLGQKMKTLCHAAYESGVAIAWAGTHPISRWDTQTVTDDDRFRRLIDQLQYVARRLVTFGVHVHVGMPDGEAAIAVMSDIVRYVPHMLALSANSPFWYGKPSGLQSARIKALEALPRGGLPPEIMGWTDFCHLFNTLQAGGGIESIKELWWDIRPHPDFGTLEVRIFDTPLTFDEVVSMAALAQSLVVWAEDRRKRGLRPDRINPAIIAQNKWWAARYGLDTDFIDDVSGHKIPARDAISNLVEELSETAESLGALDDLMRIRGTLDRGTGATLQMGIYERAEDPADVVKFLLDQNVCGSWTGEACPARAVTAAPDREKCATSGPPTDVYEGLS